MLAVEQSLHQRFFLIGQEYESSRQSEHLLERFEMYERFFMGCGDEYCLFCNFGKSHDGQIVQIRHKYENVIIADILTDIAYCRRRVRALLFKPYLLGINVTFA